MDKLDTAIERMRFFAQISERNYNKPLLLCYSGGKDSDTLIEIAKIAGINFEVQNSHTTADAPETVYHIRKKFKVLEEAGIKCQIHYPTYKGKRTTMWGLIPQKMFPPTRLARYCCQVLKEGAGAERAICTGVRWDESTKRKNGRGIYETITPKKEDKLILRDDNDEKRQLVEHCQLQHKVTCNPIVDWGTDEVYDFLRDQKVELNPLYAEFGRVGCVGCPFAGGKKQKQQFVRWPKYKQMYIHAFDRLIDVRKVNGKPPIKECKTGEELMDWWLGEDTRQEKMDLKSLIRGDEKDG